jgi:nucleoside-diphosphate-sugar epimerase
VKVLVTGGRGFLGSHVCEALVAAGHEAVPLGRVDGDLAEPGVIDALLDEHRPQAVVHLAAVMPGDDRLVQNAPITELVAHACDARAIRLFHGSSTAVYADDTPYADSKRASEEAAGDATLLRFAWPYGPGQRRGAIPTMIEQARAGDRIVAYRGWERSFCYASDVARAVAMLVGMGADGTWDIGRDDDPHPLSEIAQLACRLTGAAESSIDVVDPPVGPAPTSARLDLDRLHSLGWKPEVELEDGMSRTLGWLLSPSA